MHFNDGYERKKFIKKHEKMRKEYRKAGMSEEEIDEIFLYDFGRCGSGPHHHRARLRHGKGYLHPSPDEPQ